PAALGAARDSVTASKLGEQATRRTTAANARLAYYGWVGAKLQVEIAEQALEQSEAHLADVRTAAEAGSATPADVWAVRAQVASNRLLVDQAPSLTRSSEERIRTLMHGGAPKDLLIGDDVRIVPAPIDRGATVDSLYRRATSARPELRALE